MESEDRSTVPCHFIPISLSLLVLRGVSQSGNIKTETDPYYSFHKDVEGGEITQQS